MEETLKSQMSKEKAVGTEGILAAYERTMPSVYRLCYSYLKNRADTQDAVQSVYVRLMQSGKVFESWEHEKAWLFVTAKNLCKNHLRHWWRTRRVYPGRDGGDVPPAAVPEADHSGVREAVLNLPEKYKILVFLYYYEGYDTKEIANMLDKNRSTVRRQLAEARAVLGGVLSEEE